MEQNLVTVRTYAGMYGVTPECVRKWVRQKKVQNKVIDGVNFIVLTDEEVKQRESLFSQHPTKGLHRIGDVMNAMFNGKSDG